MSEQHGTTVDHLGQRHDGNRSDTLSASGGTVGRDDRDRVAVRQLYAVTGEPRSALDLGCTTASLVQAWCELGVDAHGVALDPAVLAEAESAVRERITVGSLDGVLDGRYDLVTCLGVLAELTPLEAERAIDNICAVTDRIVVSSTLDEDRSSTAATVRTPADWAAAMATRGFFRRTDVDLSFMSPWAAYFERAHLTPRDVVHRYESLTSPLSLALRETRDALRAARSDRTGSADAEVIALRHEALRLRDHAMGAEAEAGTARGQIAQLGMRINELSREIEDMKRSERWRLGGALLSPAATLRRKVKGN